MFYIEDGRLVEMLEGFDEAKFRTGLPKDNKVFLETKLELLVDTKQTFAERFANDPNNGTDGLWHVKGMRRGIIVRATSAPEAVQKASEVVQDWELIDAKFLGTEMPDMYVMGH